MAPAPEPTFAPPAPVPNPGITASGNSAAPLGAGAIILSNYWVAPTVARPGQRLTVHYVINNGTGTTVQLWLGASIKPMGAGRWSAEAISDPKHDVVAVVPPGLTTHTRYFDLSPALRPGTYDVAWGLRAGTSGQRVALVTASSLLRVTG